MNPEFEQTIDATPVQLSPDDLAAYRYFFQMFKQQEDALRQYQTYTTLKYKLDVTDRINLDNGIVEKL
jgi:hypothetical protein